jgi:capsular polysaccharide biosynthesis protein/tetratricopeptide (TPR) repeat protein
LQLQLHELHYNLGHVLHQQGDLQGAIASYQQAIALCPDHVSAHYNLAVALEEQGQAGLAIAQYRQTLSLQTETGLNQLGVAAYLSLGQALIQQGQVDEAIQTCQQALALGGHSQAELYCCLGEAFAAQGQVEQAIATYQKAISLNPNLAVAHYKLGKIWQQQGQHAAAADCFQRVIQLLPDQAEVYGDCGLALLALGKVSEAMQCWQRAIALQQFFVDSFCQRVANLTESESLTQAKIACGRFLMALQRQPDDPSVVGYLQQTYLHLANALIEYGGREIHNQAETYYCQAIRLQPQDPMLHLWLEDCQVTRRRLDEAIAYYPQIAAPAPSCLGLNCSPCLSQIFRAFEPIHLGKGIHTFNQRDAIAPTTPLFVTKIAGGRAWIAPQKNYWQICNAIAIFTPDDRLLADVSREYPGQLPSCQNAPTHHRISDLKELPPLEQIRGNVAVLSGLSGHVYFHWMVDILPRLELLRESGIWDEIDYFLVNSYQQPFQKETLTRLGIPAEKVLESDRHPYLQAEGLIVPSFAGHLGWLQGWALEFLRSAFLPPNSVTISGAVCSQKWPRSHSHSHSQNHLEYPERLYISRSQARYRNVLNETEVIHLLEQYGFAVITLESLTFDQQIALFAAARVIVAPHGSGLTNLVFCSPGTQVVELVSPHYIRHYYWVISQHLRLEHYYLPGEGFACQPLRELMYQNPLTEDILVKLEALQSWLKRMDLNPTLSSI